MRWIVVMALALNAFAARAGAQTQDGVRLFAPVPPGPIASPNQAPAPQSADAPPRALMIRPALDVDVSAVTDQPPPAQAQAAWQVVPQGPAEQPAPEKSGTWQKVTATSAAPPAASQGAPH